MSKGKSKHPKKAADATRQTVYTNAPRDLVQRIHDEAARLSKETGYPHSVSSVIVKTLLDRFPPPAAEPPTESAKEPAP